MDIAHKILLMTLLILIIGKFVSVLSALMQSAFKLVEQWCNEQKAIPDKTKLILLQLR